MSVNDKFAGLIIFLWQKYLFFKKHNITFKKSTGQRHQTLHCIYFGEQLFGISFRNFHDSTIAASRMSST